MVSARHGLKGTKLSIGGAVLAALAASSCCLGPLLLAALGVGGAGAFATLAAYRPYVLGVTVVLLGLGFYLTYRTPEAVMDETCGCDPPNGTVRAGKRAGKIGLWGATALVALFASAPPLLARVAAHRSPVDTSTDVALEHAVLEVHGMDCEACAVSVRQTLQKVGGFRDLTLDLKTQSITVTYEPAPGRLDAYLAAVNQLGYEASLPPGTRNPP